MDGKRIRFLKAPAPSLYLALQTPDFLQHFLSGKHLCLMLGSPSILVSVTMWWLAPFQKQLEELNEVLVLKAIVSESLYSK